MERLVPNTEEMRRITNDRKALKGLWQKIEEQSQFTTSFKTSKKENLERLLDMLLLAIEQLGVLHQKLFMFLHKHAAKGTLRVPVKKPAQVDRRSADGLSVREFIDKYARVGKPVVITGLNITDGEPWTLDYFERRCNASYTKLMSSNKSIQTWGHLEEVEWMHMGEFIRTFQLNETRRKFYLHDVSIPRNCHQAFGPPPYRDFTVPKYFAGDYFQRAPFQGYQHSWPSLFIGAKGTESAMHIDGGGTSFWLYLLSGRKEWRFFSRDDLVNLYSGTTHSSFYVDVFNPDLKTYPLIQHAQMYTAIQEPGELFFIPAGNPHGVRNLEDIHGISMNYVDASNVWLFLMSALSTGDWKAVEMFTDGKTFTHGLQSDQQAMQFGQWKSTPWKHLVYDIY